MDFPEDVYFEQLNLSFKKIRAKPEDEFEQGVGSTGDLVVHQMYHAETSVPALRVHVGMEETNACVIYEPERDSINKIHPQDAMRLKEGPSLFRMKVHDLRRKTLQAAHDLLFDNR